MERGSLALISKANAARGLVHCRGQFNSSRFFLWPLRFELTRADFFPLLWLLKYVAPAYAGVEIQTRFGYEGNSLVDCDRLCEKPYCFRGSYP
jgi:hypothetical protein